jgi:hypothetical protein
MITIHLGGDRQEEKIVALFSDGYNAELKISVSPNPINQIANIAFSAPESGMFNLIVTNQAGQVMYTAKTIGDKGNNYITYNAYKLSKGSYYFILEDENGNRTQQMVIK